MRSRWTGWAGVLVALSVIWALPGVAAELTGPLTQGALVLGKTAPGTKVYLGKRLVAVTPSGRFVLGFGRDEALKQTLREVLPSGKTVSTTLNLQRRDYRIQKVTGVPQKTVTPDPADAKRIAEEAALVKKARDRVDAREDFLVPFIWPAQGPISGVYGSQRYYNGNPGNPHFGVDVAAPKGAPVIAPAPGIVSLVHPDMFFSGGTIIIDHGYGLSSTFIHLSRVDVKQGQAVKQGQLIGHVGSTGRASGPHLDWRMNWFDVRVDPATIAPPLVRGHTPK